MADQYVYGLHAVNALLTNPHRSIYQLLLSADKKEDSKLEEILALCAEKKIPVERLPVTEMKKRFADFNHQGVVAKASPLVEYNESHLKPLLSSCPKAPLILILDSVTDPHNLGACLRSADASGVDFVIIPKDKSASITPVVSKVACGAAEAVPLVRVTNLVRALELLKKEGVWIYGAAGEATTSLYSMDCTGPIALVMGAEGDGLRRLTREHCDGLFFLPMLGTVSSLNVSVATGICLYEVVRQRGTS